MPNFKTSPAGGPTVMKMYGQGKNPIMMSEAQRTKLPSKVVDAIDKKEKDSGILMYDKGSMAKIKASPARVDPKLSKKLSKKAKIVEMSKKHENSPGFKEYRDSVFGGKTTVKGKVSTTRTPA